MNYGLVHQLVQCNVFFCSQSFIKSVNMHASLDISGRALLYLEFIRYAMSGFA